MKTYTTEVTTTPEWPNGVQGKEALQRQLWHDVSRQLWEDHRGGYLPPMIISATLCQLPKHTHPCQPPDLLNVYEMQVTPMEEILAPLLQLQQFAKWEREKVKPGQLSSPHGCRGPRCWRLS